jgi:hypothetical protein
VRQHVEGRRHEREVRERLREVPEHPAGDRVVFLREQTDVVRQSDEPLEERMCVVVPAEQLVAVAEPERAREEHTLAARQPVGIVGVVRAVAEHEAVPEQLALDRLDRPADARIRSRQEADEWDQQEARVELRRAVRLRERAELLVEALLADLSVDPLTQVAPVLDAAVETVRTARSNATHAITFEWTK